MKRNFVRAFVLHDLSKHETTILLVKYVVVNCSATDEVMVYGSNKEKNSNDAFLAYPVDTLGSEYYAVTHSPSEQPCEMMVIGVEDGTTVNITYPNNANVGVTYGKVTYGAGDTQTLTLNRFDTYQAQSVGDLSGAHVVSDKPVVMFSGNQLTNVNPLDPNGAGGTRDHMVDQLMPVKTWGKEFGYVATGGRTVGDDIKILVSEDATTIKVSCSSGLSHTFTKDAGEFAEYHSPSSIVCSVSADKPIMLTVITLSGLSGSL
ncbi:FCGBP-like protein [Mya arenaria]|uniref:FCGBP-like protein n=1 Tax=Mya arenaria TaxID=6604 RepID=A0ABY7EVQ6_MYAAR|nr:FCGBP-like protein [Mya arenaria]